MYQTYFNLQEPPFSITPDPRFLFLGRHHREALAHLLYSVRGSSGFILLTGEVGSGKTTVSRCLVRQTDDQVDVALIFNPRLSALELIASICDELGVSYPETPTLKTLYDVLNQYLLSSHANMRNTVLILDEAQNLSVDLLEQVRLLSNLETDKKKLLQIILIGQPELLKILARPDLRQFSQRVTARYHIAPLNLSETRAFIRHRLSVAGCQREIFSLLACWIIFRAAQGIPRQINQMCDRALLGAYTLGRHRVGGWIAYTAVREVLGRSHSPVRRTLWLTTSLVVVLAVALMLAPSWKDVLFRTGSAWLQSTHKMLSDYPFWSSQVASLAVTPPLAELQPPEPSTAQPEKPITPLSDTSVTPDLLMSGFVDNLVNKAPSEDPIVLLSRPLVVTEPAPALATPSERVADPTRTEEEPAAFSEPARLSLELLFRTASEETTNQNGTLAHLFDLWGVGDGKKLGDSLCEWALTVGLSCYHFAGNWNTIRQLGVPVMIHLAYFDKEPRYAVVTALGRTSITLRMARWEETFPISEVERYWFGPMTMVWRLTPGKKKFLGPGMRGADILWLREQLARVQKEESGVQKSWGFDAGLQNRVRQWQMQHFLEPDGMAGMRTILALDLALQDPTRPTPKLRLLSEGGS